jgi:branched-chain amino acid transport system ATP-binding protein
MRHDSEKVFLRIRGLGKSFGGLRAVDDFSAEIKPGEIVGLIGPNGAGKTTVFNLISGLDSPDSGSIEFHGKIIQNRPAHWRARLGMARTFQTSRLPGGLSVLDSVKTAFHSRARYSVFHAALRIPPFQRIERGIERKSMMLLKIFGLEDVADKPAGALPYGKRRELEILRALATKPSLLLLDEPAAGLNPAETGRLTEIIPRLRDRFKTAVFLIEHDMRLVMSVCERVIVINFGRIIAEGVPEEIRGSRAVREAYLGSREF